MTVDQAAFMELVQAIVRGDEASVLELLREAPGLATTQAGRGASRADARDFYFDEISHYLYAADTALHIAAAAYRPEVVIALVTAGADVRARNRRGAEPLHYAADGGPGTTNWRPDVQAETIAVLLRNGADPNALDNSGVAPLHRAVRCRCAKAVEALLECGADPELPNKSGSTPMRLALSTTGRGGSGSEAAKAQQALIVALLDRHGAESTAC